MSKTELVLVPYLICNVLLVIGGLISTSLNDGGCRKPMNRLEYVFPGVQVGCWLGEVPK